MKYLLRFHSPKRGVMSATYSETKPQDHGRFIPLNGASCLQRKSFLIFLTIGGFIPLNGASCLQL